MHHERPYKLVREGLPTDRRILNNCRFRLAVNPAALRVLVPRRSGED